MGTRKVKDAKDFGELIYFKSHAKATYMSDGSTVEDAINTKTNVQSDWNEINTENDAYIKNKPIVPTAVSELDNDLGFLTEHQDISNKQDILVSGSNIKTINNESILGSGNITTATKTSDLVNDSNFVSDANNDDIAYVRKNSEWIPISEALDEVSFTIVDSDGSPAISGSGDTSWIKGKRCLVKKIDYGVAICYLDDNNSELFHDGITTALLDGSMGQWMTDIPEYYFSVDESIEGSHTMNIYQYNKVNSKQSRRVLLGVTEGVEVDGKLWSRKTGSESSTGNLTSTVFHNYANAVGSGFDIIDYEAHCKIAHLFYAKYKDRNPQLMDLFGYGQDSYTRTIGTTSSLGNNDGKTSTQISFLGIEDFYGGKYEWMGGINGYNGTYYIYDGYQPDQVPTVPYRTVYCGFDSYTSGWIKGMKWGEYGDMIPTLFGADSATYYCDYGLVAYSGWRVVDRSYSSAYANGSVASFGGLAVSSAVAANVGSRLLFRGNIKVIDNPAEFIALPVGF